MLNGISMPVKDLRRLVRPLVLLGLAGACTADPAGRDPVPPGAVLAIAGGNGQHVVAGGRTAVPLAVRVEDEVQRTALSDVMVEFRVTRGEARLSDATVRSGPDGVARTDVTVLGPPGDTVVVLARVGSRPAERFTVLIDPGPVVHGFSRSTVRSGDTLDVYGTALHSASMPGQVTVNHSSAAILVADDTLLRVVVPPCLVGDEAWLEVRRGGGRSFPRPLRHVTQATTLSLAPAAMVTLDARGDEGCVRLDGSDAEYLITAQYGAGAELPVDREVTLRVTGGPSGPIPALLPVMSAERPALRFESVLRERERALAASGAGGMAAMARAPAVIPSVGDRRKYSVIATLDASRFDTVTAVLRHAGSNVLVWVDTVVNVPDYALTSLSTWFDGELYAGDVAAFGLPSDVDGDGRVHVVLTPVVNGLTPTTQCSVSGFVAGYISAHDLYPGTPHAAGSEVFYGYVPDAAGRWGCAHAQVNWERTIPMTFVHELQHLINYHQKVFARRGREETVWLNEALSHMAEELASLTQERRYPWPTGRGSLEQLFPDTAGWFILNNLVNSYLFLREPYRHSLTALAGGGTLEERGAGWLFVRWLTDRFGDDLPRQLVQSPRRGAENIVDRTGVPMDRLWSEFTVAAYADSLPGHPRETMAPHLRLRSRNLRQLYARLNVILDFPGFPITPSVIAPGGSVTGVLRSGGMFYARVRAPQTGGVAFRFTPSDGGAWSAADAPRITVLRLP